MHGADGEGHCAKEIAVIVAGYNYTVIHLLNISASNKSDFIERVFIFVLIYWKLSFRTCIIVENEEGKIREGFFWDLEGMS